MPAFDTDNSKKKFSTAEVITWLMGKIGANLPPTEGLKATFIENTFLTIKKYLDKTASYDNDIPFKIQTNTYS